MRSGLTNSVVTDARLCLTATAIALVCVSCHGRESERSSYSPGTSSPVATSPRPLQRTVHRSGEELAAKAKRIFPTMDGAAIVALLGPPDRKRQIGDTGGKNPQTWTYWTWYIETWSEQAGVLEPHPTNTRDSYLTVTFDPAGRIQDWDLNR